MEREWLAVLIVALGLAVALGIIFNSPSALLSPSEGNTELFYEFESIANGKTPDSSIKKRDGSVVGANLVDGIEGKALNLDGTDDYVSSGADIDLTNTFSVSAWIKPSALPTGANQYYRIVGKSAFPDEFSYNLDIKPDGHAGFSFFDQPTGTAKSVASTNKITPNKWTQLTATYGGSKLKLYIDGKLDKEVSASGSVANTAQPVRVGAGFNKNVNAPGSLFKGQIDNVRIDKRVLAAWEIESWHNLVRNEKQLEYRFDSLVDNKFTDFSDNHYNGIPEKKAVKLVDGINDNALNFNGDNIVDAGNLLNLRDEFSISGWFKLNELTRTNNKQMILSKGREGESEYSYSVFVDSNNKLVFEINPENSVAKTKRLASPQSIREDAWNFFTINFNNGNAEIYLDGRLAKSENFGSNRPYWNSYLLTIGGGRSVQGPKYFLNGSIDDLVISKKVLSASEIQKKYDDETFVLYYKFSDDSQFKDESSHAHVGLVEGNLKEVDGVSGNALEFDGKNDFIRVYDSHKLDLSGTSFTISTWIKTSGSDEALQIILEKNDAAGTGQPFKDYGIWVNNNHSLSEPGTFNFFFKCGTVQEVSSDTRVDDGNWHHVVAVRDLATKSLKVYVDGESEGQSIDNSCEDLSTNEDLYIGARFEPDLQFPFKGTMDELRIYTKALTPNEIEMLFEDDNPGSSGSNGTGTGGGNGGGSGSCTEVWDCIWTQCSGGQQTYDCIDLNSCGTEDKKPTNAGEIKQCTVTTTTTNTNTGNTGNLPGNTQTSISKTAIYWIIGILVLAIAIVGVIVFLKLRKRNSGIGANRFYGRPPMPPPRNNPVFPRQPPNPYYGQGR